MTDEIYCLNISRISCSDDDADLPTICQLSMKLHYPPRNYGLTMPEFTGVFASLLKRERYVLLSSEEYPESNAHCILLINIQHRDCIKKYICTV